VNKLASILLLVPLALLGACGSDGGDDLATDPIDTDPTPGEETGTPTGGIDPTDSAAPSEQFDTSLEGIWESPCLLAQAPATTRRYIFRVFADDFLLSDVTYGQTGCADGSELREVISEGGISEPVPEDGRDIADGLPIDLAVRMVMLTPRIGRVADDYNMLGLCDHTDWRVGTPRGVIDCTDETGTVGVETAARTDYNLFLIDDRGTGETRDDDQLWLGTLEAQPESSQRPLGVNREVTFTRRAEGDAVADRLATIAEALAVRRRR